MESEEVRRGYAARGFCAFSPWNHPLYTYSVLQLYLGNNPLSKLEIVSSLNVFNLALYQYFYKSSDRPAKYNPKVYFGAIQSASRNWNYDRDNARQNLAEGLEKSGSYKY